MTLTMTAHEVEQTWKLTTRMALVLEYDGTDYAGFQWQANVPSIQSELENAVEKLTGEKVRVLGSSRTDTGVHARGQVVSFDTTSALTADTFVSGLNFHLPEDIAVKSACPVGDSFLVRSMAVSREYSYTILNCRTRSPITSRFAHRVSGELNVEKMNRMCQSLVGSHDFASFASDISDEPEMSTTRQVYQATVQRNRDMVVFRIMANAFIRHQIRSTAGALVQVGSGKLSEAEFVNILEAKQVGLAGPTLPPCGLCLERVNYPCSFEEMRR
jgi:tRNA pseudouridine38-40 synthase